MHKYDHDVSVVVVIVILLKLLSLKIILKCSKQSQIKLNRLDSAASVERLQSLSHTTTASQGHSPRSSLTYKPL